MKRTIKQAFILSMIALMAGSVAFAQAPSIALTSSEVKTVGNQLKVTATFDLSNLHLKGNRTLVIYPIVTGSESTPAEGKETKLPLLVINGTKKHILYERNPAKHVALEVKRYNGKHQSVDYSSEISKKDWMNLSTINYYYDLCGCGNETEEYGFLTVSDVPNEIHWMPMSAKFIPEPMVRQGSAFIQFYLDDTTIDTTLGSNSQELNKIVETIKEISAKQNDQVVKVTIHGYASPEGKYAHNAKLAEARTRAVVDFVQEKTQLSSHLIEMENTPEDMEGFLLALQTSTYPGREEAIKYIEDVTLTPDQKEGKIKQINGGQLYAQYKKEVLPYLRHTDYLISYREMTNREVDATHMFPTGSREAINNQGVQAIKDGQINQAKELFQKAASMGLNIAQKNLSEWKKLYQWN